MQNKGKQSNIFIYKAHYTNQESTLESRSSLMNYFGTLNLVKTTCL